jgi:peptide/nickel transport system substrate-binding protein
MSTSLTPILPKHIFGDGTDVKVHPRNANPIGSGPFKLVEFKPGEFTVLERFDKFFLKDTPKLNRVIIREFKDTSSMMLAFERGEIDIHSELTDAGQISRASKLPNVTLASTSPAIGPIAWLAFNTKSPKLADKRVRQAINFAIDKKYLLETLLGKVHTRATGPIAAGSPFYEPKVEKYDLNLQKAAQLLDEAGLKPGANGIRLTLDLDYIPGSVELMVSQEYTKIALSKVGIEVNVRASPDFPSWARRVASHQFDMTLDSVWNWGDPVIGVHRTWLSSNIKPGIIWSNTQNYSNPKVDDLLANAAKESSMAKRKAMYSQMQKIVVDDCPVAFLIEINFNMAFHNKIQNRPAGIWGLVDGINDSSIKA